MLTKIKEYLLERAFEKSTILGLLGLMDLGLTAASKDAISIAVQAVLSAVLIVVKEQKK